MERVLTRGFCELVDSITEKNKKKKEYFSFATSSSGTDVVVGETSGLKLFIQPHYRCNETTCAAMLHQRNVTRIGSAWWNNALLLYSDASASRRRCVPRRSLSRRDANLGETMREEKRIIYYCICTILRRALSSCLSAVCHAINLLRVDMLKAKTCIKDHFIFLLN